MNADIYAEMLDSLRAKEPTFPFRVRVLEGDTVALVAALARRNDKLMSPSRGESRTISGDSIGWIDVLDSVGSGTRPIHVSIGYMGPDQRGWADYYTFVVQCDDVDRCGFRIDPVGFTVLSPPILE